MVLMEEEHIVKGKEMKETKGEEMRRMFCCIFIMMSVFMAATAGAADKMIVLPLGRTMSHHWKGEWLDNTAYQRGDAVQYMGSSYVCLYNHTSSVANEPPGGAWDLFALQGGQGEPGARGEVGLQGPPGVQGARGAQGVPGLQGAQGIQGPQGEPGVSSYSGTGMVAVDNGAGTIGLNPASSNGDVISWNGNNWVAARPTTLSVTSYDESNMQPYNTINFIIALQGGFPSRNSMDPFIAEIIMFGGNFAPRGWAFCDGQLIGVNQNSALFSLIGCQYGGDCRTTFALPDLRGRVPIHAGSGPGLTPRRLAERGGIELNATHRH